MLPKVFMKSAISWKKYDTLITFERFLVVYHMKRAILIHNSRTPDQSSRFFRLLVVDKHNSRTD